jgi:imidazole glycerol-phosphate synthase subunit HisH
MTTSSAGRTVVGLVDYKAGNVQSIENSFTYAGAEVVRLTRAADLDRCTHVVLPGVGAFGFCAERLAATNLKSALDHWAFTARKPLMGICVGMQLMADGSDESPAAVGLGWIGGQVRRFTGAPGVRVPHVGWNSVRFTQAWGDFPEGFTADFYFDHSFAYGPPRLGTALGVCRHGEEFSAIIRRDNIIAVQCHPEKSQTAGLRLIENFLRA